MMDDLKTDAVPVNSPKENMEQNLGGRPTEKAPATPRSVNISNCKDVHIGSVYHTRPQPKPQVDAKNMPLQKEVDALRRCHREIEDKDKYIASEHLGTAWKSLGRSMGFSSGQIENIEADYTRNADRANEILNRWHDRESDGATIARLTQLIIEVKAYHVLKYIKPLYQ